MATHVRCGGPRAYVQGDACRLGVQRGRADLSHGGLIRQTRRGGTQAEVSRKARWLAGSPPNKGDRKGNPSRGGDAKPEVSRSEMAQPPALLIESEPGRLASTTRRPARHDVPPYLRRGHRRRDGVCSARQRAGLRLPGRRARRQPAHLPAHGGGSRRDRGGLVAPRP
jgi:hypothetical protein